MATDNKSKLLAIFETLNEGKQTSLIDYAEFLQSKGDLVSVEVQAPLGIERPSDESVVGAIKRLKQTYPMIESMSVFSAASSLMTEHMINGRDVIEVVDEMQVIFEEAYQVMTVISDDSEK
jgi:hypothetical protein